MAISNRLTTLTLAAVLGICVTNSAAAVERTQYTFGAALGACTPNSDHPSFVPGYSDSLVYNAATNLPLYLDCSLPIATASVADAGEALVFVVSGVNRSTSENLTCNFEVVTPLGFTVTTLATKSVTPGTSANMLWPLINLHVLAPGYASCQIPRQQGASKSGLTALGFTYSVYPD